MKTKYVQMFALVFVSALFFSSCSKLDEFYHLINHKHPPSGFDSTLFKIKEIDVTNSHSTTQYRFSYNANNDITDVTVYSQNKGTPVLQYAYGVTYNGRKILKVTTTSGSGNYSDNFQYHSPGQLSHYLTHYNGIDNYAYNVTYNAKSQVDSFGYSGEHKNADYFNYQYGHKNNISLINQYTFFRFLSDSFVCSYDNKLSPFHYFLKNWYAIHMDVQDNPFNEALRYYWAEATFSKHNMTKKIGQYVAGSHIREKFNNKYDKKKRLIKQLITQDIYKFHNEFTVSISYY